MSLFSRDGEKPIGTTGDAAIFSIRKFLPIPDGGALVLNDGNASAVAEMDSPATFNQWSFCRARIRGKLVRLLDYLGLRGFGQWLKFRLYPPQVLYSEDPDQPIMNQDKYFDPRQHNWGMSQLSMGLIANVNPQAIITQRRNNYLRLVENLKHLNGVRPLFPNLIPGVCPLYLPLVVENRQAWHAALLKYGVCVYPLWRSYHPDLSWEEFPEARWLKNHVLALPVHQQLKERQMDSISEIVELLSQQVFNKLN